jgi:hypothetical protein
VVPLIRATGLRLLVTNDPAPWLVDVDRGTVRPLTGLPSYGDRVVWVLPAGREAVVVSDGVCEGCWPQAADVYRVRPGGTAATRLGSAMDVVAARDAGAVWLLTPRAARGCTLGRVGLDGRRRGPARPVSCATRLLGETSAGLLLAAGPPNGSDDPWDRPTVLLDRRGRITRLGFPGVGGCRRSRPPAAAQRRTAGAPHPDRPARRQQLAAGLAEPAPWRRARGEDASGRPAAKCFLGVHAAWLSSSPTGGCWWSANGLPICDST